MIKIRRSVGTVVRGIRTPVIKEKCDLSEIVIKALMEAQQSEGFEFKDRDIVGITEAVVGISEGNYVTVDDIAQAVSNKFSNQEIGLVFPILSRNRFALILKGIARAMNKITILVSFPNDEVGNGIMDETKLENSPFNLESIITEQDYNCYFKTFIHPYTGLNMVSFYRDLIEKENCQVEFVFANRCQTILKYTNNILNCDIHTRIKTKKILQKLGAHVLSLTDILSQPLKESGYHAQYGLLGSNKVSEEKLKLFPCHGDCLVSEIQTKLFKLTGKRIEVMIFGDGAFKDPVSKIWELADPVVAPAYTDGLKGTPNELKLKYVSDNLLRDYYGEELNQKIKQAIKTKAKNLTGNMLSEGTTPRQYTDLIGSLCDLTVGSGDKGTPIVYIQGYFDNYADED